MFVRRLELVDFRSYPHVVVEFAAGCSVLVGPNGIGKTNLVEGLHYLSTLDSHRVAVDAPLVRAGAASSVIRGEIVHDGRSLLVELALEPGKANRARLNGSPVRRPRDILGALRMVLFAPEDIALVRGDPAERRRYLDDLLVARQPRYAGVRADYERVLKQRNALLRTAYLARKVAAGRGAAALAYRPCVEGGPDRAALTQALAGALAAARPSEVDRGVTLVGPHRDDVTLTLGELPAKGYASHGESWSFALALRLAAYELLRAEGVEPVLALDDVFAELDTGRRDRLAELVGGAAQLIVTCAVPEDVPARLGGVRYDVSEREV